MGAGLARQKYVKHLQTFFRKTFEDYRRNAFKEADLRCSNVIRSMEKNLRASCHDPGAKIDDIVMLLDGMLTAYEMSSHGPGKWQKLAIFLQQSLESLVVDLAKKQLNQAGSETNALSLICRSIEEKTGLLNKQLEASEKNKTKYVRHFGDAINDKKKLAEDYTRSITKLQSRCSSLEERCSSLLKAAESSKRESIEWKRKYQQVSSKLKTEEDLVNAEKSAVLSRISVAEARLAAAREQLHSAEEEATEWKRKFDLAGRETKAALEKEVTVQERSNKQIQAREEVLRAQFYASLAEKDKELRDKVATFGYTEQRFATTSLELKAVESKIKNYEVEFPAQKHRIKELEEKLEAFREATQSFEREARLLEQEKMHLEKKYLPELKRFDEAQERCRIAEKDAKRATELADRVRAEAVIAQREKSEVQRVAMERITQIERAQRLIEGLERQKADLMDEIRSLQVSEKDALLKVGQLEARVEEREQEIESLLRSNNEQRTDTVQVLEKLLQTERAARGEANRRAETLSLQLQSAQGKLDLLQQEFTSTRLTESALDSKLRTASHGKRSRFDDCGWESVQDMDIGEEITRVRKRSKSTATTSHLKTIQVLDGGSALNVEDNRSRQTGSEDYTKFTIVKLRQELTEHGFGAELLQLKNPNKKDILSLYEKHVHRKY